MRTTGLDHVGIAVASIEDALPFYRGVLGLELAGIEVVAEQKARTAFLPLGAATDESAGTELELLESTDPEGPIGKFLAARGEGVHHLAFRVENLDEVLAELKSAGVRLIDEIPRRGAGGARIAFIHPKSSRGVLVELCERMA